MGWLLKTLNKLWNVTILILVLLNILGLIFLDHVRSNVVTLVDTISSSGLQGLAVAIFRLYIIRKVTSHFGILIKTKGFNKEFWDSL